VEVVPFGLPLCLRRLEQLGLPAEPLRQQDQLFITDNGNYILECRVTAIPEPAKLEQQLRAIPGIVGTGLFLGMAHTVLIQDGDKLEIRQRKNPLESVRKGVRTLLCAAPGGPSAKGS
jgi:ribose 5-phosphate isomerase A